MEELETALAAAELVELVDETVISFSYETYLYTAIYGDPLNDMQYTCQSLNSPLYT